MLGTRTALTAGKRSLALAITAGAITTGAALSMSAPAAHAATQTTAKTAAAADVCWYESQNGHWWCRNRAGAPVWSRGDNPKVIGTMRSTKSWFICRKEGGRNNNGPHPNRWEWTLSDTGAWGWMKDSDISSETNPLPTENCPPQ
jgi:uncharacterized membrane protein